MIAVVGVEEDPSTDIPAGFTPIIAGFNGCTSATDTGSGIRALSTACLVHKSPQNPDMGFNLLHSGNLGSRSSYSGVLNLVEIFCSAEGGTVGYQVGELQLTVAVHADQVHVEG